MKKLFLIVSIICFVSCFPASADTRDIADGTFDRLHAKRFEKPQQMQLTPEEKEWLAEHPNIQLGYNSSFEPTVIVNPDGSYEGIVVDFLDALNRRLGTHIKLQIDPVQIMHEKAKTRETDGIILLHPNYADKLGYLKTHTYYRSYPIVFGRAGDSFNHPDDFAGKKVVIIDKIFVSRKIIEPYKDRATILQVKNALEGLQMVHKSKAALFIGFSPNSYLITKHRLFGITPKYVYHDLLNKFGMAIRPDWPELVSILNKGISSFSEREIDTIISRWIDIPVREKTFELAPEEQAWLGKNHVVRVRVSDAPPWEINTPKPQGMSVDYLTIIGRQFGINFKFLPGTDAWIDGFNDMAGDHLKYDLLPAVKRTPERLELLAISDDYLYSPWVVFTHEKIFDIFSLESLRGRKVTVERGYVMQKLLEKNEPEIELVIQESTEDALIAVSTMKADAYVGNLIVTSHLIQRAGIINVKVASPTPFGYHSQAMATRQEWTPLISIINKGLTTISQKEKTNIQNKYSAVRVEHGIRIMDIIKWVIGVSSVLLTILSIILIWNRRLKSLVAERTAKLEVELDARRKAEKKYLDFVHNSLEAVWAYDLEPPLPMDLTAEEQLNLLYERAYISEANDALARMAGFEKGENMLGMRLDDFQPRKNPENVAYVKNVVRAKFNVTDYESTQLGSAGKKHILNSNILGITKNGKLLRIWGTSRDVTEKKRLEEELIGNKKDLQKLAGWLISRQENECSRVARELHDDLTQQLAVIAIEAGNIDEQFKELPEAVRGKISHIKDKLIKVSGDVHNLSRGLHPSILYDLGLERAVRSECSNFSKRTGIAVVFEPGNVPSNVPTEISLTLYRIIQECLLNISKHAKTKSSYVILERSNGSVVLTVKDAGAGFDPEEVRGRTALGFSSMRERVRMVKGKLSITSKPGKGTSVEVKIPLKQE